MFYLFGLGNPTEKFTHSRHSAGRFFVMEFAKRHGDPAWRLEKKKEALVADVSAGKDIMCVLPERFMNETGKVAGRFISKTSARHLIVVHDDIDLPIGTAKLSFNRSAAGHLGVTSINRAIGTEKYFRIRIGISPKTPTGKIKKPRGAKVVKEFVIGNFSKKEQEIFESLFPALRQTVLDIVTGKIHLIGDSLSQTIR